jgi:CspA family cold shock protein
LGTFVAIVISAALPISSRDSNMNAIGAMLYGAIRNHSPPVAQPSPLSGRVRNGIVKRQQWRSTVALGTVKWFNSQKGYGFIQPQNGGKDVFVHISAVEKAGLSGLNEGQVVEYEEVSNKGKTSAEQLKLQR